MSSSRILLVHHEREFRLIFVQYLKSAGYQVFLAKDEQETYQILAENAIDLVLLDLDISEPNGLILLKEIAILYPSVPIIATSDRCSIDKVITAMKSGAVDFIQQHHHYIKKPFTLEEIVAVIEEVLNRPLVPLEVELDYDTLIEIGQQTKTQGNYEQAQIFAKNALKKDPFRPEAFNLLGEIKDAEGNCTDAKKLYRAALDIEPTYKIAYENLNKATTYKSRHHFLKFL